MSNKGMDVKKIHEINFEMLVEIDRICKKHKIQYFLDSGTLLGAVRHQSFIPWDDDTDIIFLRKDYNRLLAVIENELDSRFGFSAPNRYSNGLFFDFIPRIFYKSSRIRPENEEDKAYDNKNNHISLDFFILDNVPDSNLKFKLMLYKYKFYYGLAMGHRYKIRLSEYSGIEKLAVMVFSIIGKAFSVKTILNKYDKFIASAPNESKYVFASNYTYRFMNKKMKRAWFESSVSKEINGHEFDCPVGWDELLTTIYGDYMQLPPESARVPKHIGDSVEIW